MKQGMLIFMFICSMCVMARRIPRAIELDEDKDTPFGNNICAPNMPCGWSIYKPNSPDLIELNITNNYCKCGTDTVCLSFEKDSVTNSMVYRCQREKS